jgi:signal transduction histidine kinase
MSINFVRLRPWVEPTIGFLFVLFWFNAELGRFHTGDEVLVLVCFGVAIGISRLAPLWALAVTSTVIALQLLRVAPLPDSTTWPVYLSLLVVAYSAGQLPRERIRWLALACSIPFAVAIAHLMAVPLAGEPVRWTSWTGQPSSGTYIASAFITITGIGAGLYIGAWAIGFAVRLNLVQLQGRFLLQKTTRDLALAETEVQGSKDRDWIAQEVHDLLAHSLTVVTAQADGARLSPHADVHVKDSALLAISSAARAALIDMQALVEALREDSAGAPQPTLANLRVLLDRLASAGMTVTVKNFGEPKALTPAKELAIFRILQESLTNSLRHAGADVPARVSFDWRGPGLALTVTTARLAERHPPTTFVPGHGIRGMTDRARLAGGWLTAGEVDDGDASFIVAAFFPTGEGRADGGDGSNAESDHPATAAPAGTVATDADASPSTTSAGPLDPSTPADASPLSLSTGPTEATTGADPDR